MRHALLLVPLLLAAFLLPDPAGGAPERPPRVPSLPYKSKKALGELFESYFEAAEADRPDILARVAAFDPIPASVVKDFRKTLFKLAREGVRVDGKAKSVLDHPDYPQTFLLSGASGNKVKGLLIGLHGGGEGNGDGATSAQKWQSAQGENCICVFPTVLEKLGTAWNKERMERQVLALIEAVKRTYRIDTNRIFLAGHSMGGYGTWSIGGHHADLFAAITPNAGGVFGMARGGKVTGLANGILPNLHNTPVYFTHGADDKQVSVEPDRLAAKLLGKLKKLHPGGYDFTYKEYPDIGHGLPPGGSTPLIKWLTAHERNPNPLKVVWEPTVSYKRSFYWLRKAAPGGGVIVAERTDENRFEITCEGKPQGLSLLLNDELIDFKKKVVVLVNGEEVFHDFVLMSAAAMLESIAERNDPNLYFTARLNLP